MSLPGIGTPVRGSGRDQSIWKLEWTFTDGAGAVSLDEDQSDQDPRVATPVADGGTGTTNVTVPTCRRMWALHCSLEPPAADLADGTDYRLAVPVSFDPAEGTLVVKYPDIEGNDLVEPNSGSRVRLTLMLEYT